MAKPDYSTKILELDWEHYIEEEKGNPDFIRSYVIANGRHSKKVNAEGQYLYKTTDLGTAAMMIDYMSGFPIGPDQERRLKEHFLPLWQNFKSAWKEELDEEKRLVAKGHVVHEDEKENKIELLAGTIINNFLINNNPVNKYLMLIFNRAGYDEVDRQWGLTEKILDALGVLFGKRPRQESKLHDLAEARKQREAKRLEKKKKRQQEVERLKNLVLDEEDRERERRIREIEQITKNNELKEEENRRRLLELKAKEIEAKELEEKKIKKAKAIEAQKQGGRTGAPGVALGLPLETEEEKKEKEKKRKEMKERYDERKEVEQAELKMKKKADVGPLKKKQLTLAQIAAKKKKERKARDREAERQANLSNRRRQEEKKRINEEKEEEKDKQVVGLAAPHSPPVAPQAPLPAIPIPAIPVPAAAIPAIPIVANPAAAIVVSEEKKLRTKVWEMPELAHRTIRRTEQTLLAQRLAQIQERQKEEKKNKALEDKKEDKEEEKYNDAKVEDNNEPEPEPAHDLDMKHIAPEPDKPPPPQPFEIEEKKEEEKKQTKKKTAKQRQAEKKQEEKRQAAILANAYALGHAVEYKNFPEHLNDYKPSFSNWATTANEQKESEFFLPQKVQKKRLPTLHRQSLQLTDDPFALPTEQFQENREGRMVIKRPRQKSKTKNKKRRKR